MSFLHDGRPPVVRQARFTVPPCHRPLRPDRWRLESRNRAEENPRSPSVASKHWIIRQYDHEVQAGSVVKPLVGASNDGPADAAVVRRVLRSDRAIAVGCGMNPLFGDLDAYTWRRVRSTKPCGMWWPSGVIPTAPASSTTSAGAITDRPETLGSLVRAALACRDLSLAFGTPSSAARTALNNEFSYTDGVASDRPSRFPPRCSSARWPSFRMPIAV